MAGLRFAAGVFVTTTGIAMPNAQSRYRSHVWTLYMWSPGGLKWDAGTTAKLQLSPDPVSTADASSEWFDVTGASFDDTDSDVDRIVNVEFKARKIRLHVTGGSDGNDDLYAELV